MGNRCCDWCKQDTGTAFWESDLCGVSYCKAKHIFCDKCYWHFIHSTFHPDKENHESNRKYFLTKPKAAITPGYSDY
jgi:hypothetical protein